MTDTTTVAAPAPKKASGAFNIETVTWVQHWTDSLFSFRTTRDPALRFSSGQFVMVGLEVEGKPLVRAYSIASPAWHEELEFYSIKVPDGPLTSRLQKIKVGDQVLIGRKPTGTLVLDGLELSGTSSPEAGQAQLPTSVEVGAVQQPGPPGWLHPAGGGGCHSA